MPELPDWIPAWFIDIWGTLVKRMPTFGIALALLIGGWLLAFIVQKSVFGLLRRTVIDEKIARFIGVEPGQNRVEHFLSKAVYYTLFAFVLVAFFSYLKIDAVTRPLLRVLEQFGSAVPNLLKALVLGVGGFLLATGARKLLVALLDRIGIERKMQEIAGEEPKDGKQPTELATTIGDVTYWFIIIVAAIPVLEALEIGALAAPLSSAFATVTTYLPKVVGAALLLVFGYVLSRFVRRALVGVLTRVGLDRAMARLGFGNVLKDTPLSGILGTIAMAFVLLQFAISAVGRLEIREISEPLGLMLQQVYAWLPMLLVGAILMAIGVLIARVTGNISARLLAAMGFNTLMVHIGLFKQVTPQAAAQEQESKKVLDERFKGVSPRETTTDDLLAEHGSKGIQTPADIAGVVVAAIVVLLFLQQVLRTMQLDALANMLAGFLAFLPNVVVAATLVGAGLWAGKWAHSRIDELTRAAEDRLIRSLGGVAHVAVVAFTAMMALQQLGVGKQLIAIAFGLLLGAVCLALALAFGLGGRDVAGRIVQKEYDRRSSDN